MESFFSMQDVMQCSCINKCVNGKNVETVGNQFFSSLFGTVGSNLPNHVKSMSRIFKGRKIFFK